MPNRAARRHGHREAMEALGRARSSGGTAKAWFDQFPGLTADSEWNSTEWCPRHWAPAALLGYLGGKAARQLLDTYMREMKPSNLTSPRAINRHLAQQGPLCCALGDDRMYILWGQCAPPRTTNGG